MSPRMFALLCVVALCVVPVVSQDPPEPEPVEGMCDDEYECIHKTTLQSTGVTYKWDLEPLCSSGKEYTVNDTGNHTYAFNICGNAERRCLPAGWDNVYEYGVAVQYWGTPPHCNDTHKPCTNFDGTPECCTENCQVLGTGPPQWHLKDPQNPETGGITVTHTGVPPSDEDPFWCPWSDKTGSQISRSITYDMQCDPNGDIGKMEILGASEGNGTSQCQYTIFLLSFHGCGCAADCAGKNCGQDGCGSYCGMPSGMCPSGYFCNADQVCCRADCAHRECGSDGCGGNCGTYPDNDGCGQGQVCQASECVRTGPTQAAHVPTVNSPGTIAGAFFGGLFATIVVGGVVFWWMKRRQGGSYTPFSAGGSSAAPPAPAGTGAPVTSSTGYGAL